MKTTNSDISLHIISNEILKPNRAHGQAGAMRQVFFLAHCKRPAQSGRRLLRHEKIDKTFVSLTSLNKHHSPADEHEKKKYSITKKFNEI